jgi:hypothetical protein
MSIVSGRFAVCYAKTIEMLAAASEHTDKWYDN